ncbi:MAG: O-antigen ligase family protein, partial [Gemmatimonadota bacterium]
LFLAFGAATLLISPDRVEGLRLLFKLAYPCLVFIAVCGLVETRRDLERLGDWVLGAAAFLALVVNPLLVLSGGYIVDARGYLRIEGLGMGTSAFSFYVLAMLLFAYARFSVRGQARYLVLGAVLAAWIVPTLTRTALGGALAGLGGAALFGALVGRNYRGLVAAVLLAAVIAVPLAPVALERTFGYVPPLGELWSLARDPVALYDAMYWTGRDELWAVVMPAFLSSPLIGIGLGGSTAVLVRNTPSDWVDVVHNEYLRLLTDTGVVGLTLFAIALALWWFAVLRAGRTGDPLAREYALPAFAGILAWAVISFPGNALDYYAQFTQYMGFFVAGAVTAARLARADAERSDDDPGAGHESAVDTQGEGRHVPAV